MPAKTSDRSVFDIYAHEYDLITNAAEREKYHKKEVAAIIKRFKPETALDAGCATGLTSTLLAEIGIATVGLDSSEAMIKVATKKAKGQKLPLEYRLGRFENLPTSMTKRFDLVVCLANSISGVPTLAA